MPSSLTLIFGLRRSVAAVAVLLSMGGLAAAQTGDAYFEFLMARRLEAQGDQEGALEALERAAAADPASAAVRAEIASFQLRRNERGDAEREALRALRLDDANREAHRVLGVIYAADVEAMGTRGPRAEVDERTQQAITHLERVTGDGAYGVSIQTYYSLGQLYMRARDATNAIDAFLEVVDQNPGAVQGRLSLARAYALADDVGGAIASLEVIVDGEPRVASTLACTRRAS